MSWMRERGLLLAIALVSQNVWLVAQLKEDPEAAERAARDGYEALMEQGHRGWASTAAAQLAISLCDLGRYDEAERMAIRGAELGGDADVVTLTISESARARVAAARGDHAHAEALARGAVARAEAMEAPAFLADAIRDLARVLAAAGRTAEAAAAAERAAAIYDEKGAIVAAGQARAQAERYRLTA